MLEGMGQRVHVLVIMLATASACGARSELFVPGVVDAGVVVGCTSDSECDDGGACTVGMCASDHTCTYTHTDMQCGVSQACTPTGCEQRAWAQDPSTLYDVRLPSCTIRTVGPTMATLTDVALSPTNTLWGVTFDQLALVDTTTGSAIALNAVAAGMNGADFGPDGTLYVSGGSFVGTVAPLQSTLQVPVETNVATFPDGFISSGDIAFVGSRLVATAMPASSSPILMEAPNSLVGFDLDAGTTAVIGPVGFPCVFGLASYGSVLYGFTCKGAIIQIDTTTGAGTLVANVGIAFAGASAR